MATQATRRAPAVEAMVPAVAGAAGGQLMTAIRLMRTQMMMTRAMTRKQLVRSQPCARQGRQHQQWPRPDAEAAEEEAGGSLQQARVVAPPTLPEQPGAPLLSSREIWPNRKYTD